MGANNSIAKHLDQDYKKLKKELISKKKLFEDPNFPLSKEILCKHDYADSIEWLRPGEICDKNGCKKSPEMIADGINRFDINQGAIGNCWFQGKQKFHSRFRKK